MKVKANKSKTRKAALKRFKVTKSGKVLHRGHGTSHKKSVKGKRQLRRLKSVKKLEGLQARTIRRMVNK